VPVNLFVSIVFILQYTFCIMDILVHCLSVGTYLIKYIFISLDNDTQNRMIYLKVNCKDWTLVRCKVQGEFSNRGKIPIEFYYSWFLAKIM